VRCQGRSAHRADLKEATVSKHSEKIAKDKSHTDNGCVTKCVGAEYKNHHGSYRYNGYAVHKPKYTAWYKPTKRRLDQFGGPQLERQLGFGRGVKKKPADPRDDPQAWAFVGENFKNANLPYAHNYHHMLPWEVIGNSFSAEEACLLQEVGYKLNEGRNMVILPCFERIANILMMYTHPNNHPTYNTTLKTMVRQARAQIRGQKEQHFTKKDLTSVKTMFESWEDAEWDIIMAAGKLARAAHVDTHTPSDLLAHLP
jgi:A nuclease family of the HNH/ENDO VII superfamily with conserved AHH